VAQLYSSVGSAHGARAPAISVRSPAQRAPASSAAPADHVGVGLAVRESPGGMYVVSRLVPLSPAAVSGQVAVGDVLHSIDGNMASAPARLVAGVATWRGV
jgi:C-terminal processing protease CtpA/Prc